nr:nuclear transport factor 2 family protein [uncultured Roseateles sp.]
MPDPAQMEAAVHEYLRALNAADLDAVLALFDADASVEDPVGSPPKRGHAEIRAFYAASLSMKLTLALEGQVRVADKEAAFAFSVSLQHEGQQMVIRPIDVFRFNEAGKVVSMRAFFGPANIGTGS